LPVSAALWRGGLVLSLLLLALPARAETILMLGVLRDGKVDGRLSRAVQERLTHAGETVLAPAGLSPQERLCASTDCLDRLVGREKAQLVLSARLQQSAGFAYITALLYDAAHQRNLDASAVCDKCLPESLSLRVGDLYERLLRDYRDRLRADARAPRGAGPAGAAAAGPAVAQAPSGAATQHAPPPPPITAPPPEPAERLGKEQAAAKAPAATATTAATAPTIPGPSRKEPLSPRRKMIAGILGGLGALALATAIGFQVTDGNPTSRDCDAAPGMPKFCVLDNKLAYTVGYAAASVFAVSLGMTLAWPEPARVSRSTSSEVK
jgi:hypothetical protein